MLKECFIIIKYPIRIIVYCGGAFQFYTIRRIQQVKTGTLCHILEYNKQSNRDQYTLDIFFSIFRQYLKLPNQNSNEQQRYGIALKQVLFSANYVPSDR